MPSRGSPVEPLIVLPEPAMTDSCRFANPQTDCIRTLNDAFRTSLTGGSVMVTRAVAALGAKTQRQILEAVYGEHDFGRITVSGHEILFKIDYYDRDLVAHSPDASDPSVTHRVLMVMLAEDY
jgi:Protein of unknown function (DUF3768)